MYVEREYACATVSPIHFDAAVFRSRLEQKMGRLRFSGRAPVAVFLDDGHYLVSVSGLAAKSRVQTFHLIRRASASILGDPHEYDRIAFWR